MLFKCVLMFLICMHMSCVCVCECSYNFQTNDSKVNGSKVNGSNSNDSTFGYKNDEVTQGVGYGHYLHPFYYRGRNQRFYNCAVEEEWKPYEKDKEITLTQLPMGKQKTKLIKLIPRLKIYPKKYILKRRNDRYYNNYNLSPHTRFIKDINSLSETLDRYHQFDSDTIVPQLIIPEDADILIVKKKPVTSPYLTSVENVLSSPLYQNNRNTVETYKGSSSNIVSFYKHPNSIDSIDQSIKMLGSLPGANQQMMLTHPYKFVTPSAEDMTMTRFKKPHQVFISSHQTVSAPPVFVYRKKMNPSYKSGQSFWERIVKNLLK